MSTTDAILWDCLAAAQLHGLDEAAAPAVRGGGWSRLGDELAMISGRVGAITFIALLGPVLLPLLFFGWQLGVRVCRRPRLGQFGLEFGEFELEAGSLSGWSLFANPGARHWPALLNLALGHIAVVGPRARAREEVDRTDRRVAALLAVKPGLVCDWWVQCRRGINYGHELDSDLQYARTSGPKTDLGVIVRAAAAWLYGAGVAAKDARCKILGVWTDNVSMDGAVETIAGLTVEGGSHQVCFVNADCLNVAVQNREYRNVLSRARLVLPDGVGVILASRITGNSIRQNVNGTDLFPRLCTRLARDHRRIFLLGGKPGVARRVKEYVTAHHPGLSVVGARHGYFTEAEEGGVIDDVRLSKADVLLVAFGAPRQELWIDAQLGSLGVPVAIGVGGLFDFYSFSKPRAPGWIRELGMEWAYRLILEPRRLWRRYLIGNWVFMTRVLLMVTRLVRYPV